MKSFFDSSNFYYEPINLIASYEYEAAIKSIKKNIDKLANHDDLALAYLNCGFLNNKLGKNRSAIDDFSMSIYFESHLDFLNERSKDISLNGRSNSKYKNGDYKGAIEDKRNANKIRLLEINKSLEVNNIKIDYKNILLGTFSSMNLEPKYFMLIKASEIKKNKYDLITDYKKVISNQRKEEVINSLEALSEIKYLKGDYKGSIKAIRRAEKYY